MKKTIQNIEEITKPNIDYIWKDTEDCVSIEISYGEFQIGFRINGRYSCVSGTSWNTVKTWKTFNGAKKALKRISADNEYGLGFLTK